jgi:excisionase family DNA binding protein
MKQESYLTPKEVARHLACSTDYVLKEIRRGKLKPILRVNPRVIRIPISTYQKYASSLAIT